MSTPTICLAVTWEPPKYHVEATDKRFVSVHLAFDAERTEVQSLLNKSNWAFNVYKVDGAGTQADRIDGVITAKWESPRTINSTVVDSWLAERGGYDGLSAPTTDNEVELNSARACDMLLGGITWDAPVPHDIQLMRILELTGTFTGADKLFLLPVDHDSVALAEDDGQVTVVLNAGEFNGYTIVTNLIPWDETAHPNLPEDLDQALAANAFPLPVRPDGFLFTVRSERDFRFLQAFEPAAANLYWSLPAFLDAGSPLAQSVTASQLARLGCAIALDLLWVSLLSPGNEDREGALLGPLKRLYEEIEFVAGDTPVEPLGWIRSKILAITVSDLLDAPAGGNSGPILKDVFADAIVGETTDSVLTRLRAFAAYLQEESGLEEILVRLLKHISPSPPNPGEEYLPALLAKYQDKVRGAFNALEAVRQDVGHLLTRWLTRQSLIDALPELIEIALASDAYTQRLDVNATANSWWTAFQPALLTLETRVSDGDGLLQEAWTKAVRNAFKGIYSERTTRFVPDRLPQPLPIPIATTTSDEAIDQFTTAFNGVAVLLRRDASAPWAHANLVSLRPLKEQLGGALEYDENEWTPGNFAVKPFLPVSTDGRREMFLQYQGIPLASTAYSATGGPGIPPVAPDEYRRSLYVQKDALLESSSFVPPPRLAYALPCDACAFAVSKGGAYPRALRQNQFPWLARPDIDLPEPETQDILTTVEYQRRTSVGSTTFGSTPTDAQRIDAQYADVFPLAKDFPRLNISAGNQHVDSLDLFRGADGSGQLRIPAADRPVKFRLALNQVIPTVNVSSASITIEVHEESNATFDAVPIAQSVLTGLALAQLIALDWEIEILASDDATTPNGPLQLKLPAQPSGSTLWIRLRLESAGAGLTWSFGRPETTDEASPGGAAAANVPILLTAAGTNLWDDRFTQAAKFDCTLSRTTWNDWERWFNNPALEIHGRTRPTANGSDLASAAARAFVDASIMRGEDPTGELSRLLDQLPDPAVSGFLIELAQVDRIDTAATSDWTMLQLVFASPDWLSDVDIPEDLDPDDTDLDVFKKYFSDLKKYLVEIGRQFQVPMEVTCAAASLAMVGGKLRLSVPAGSVGKLKVRPLVKTANFRDGDSLTPFVEDLLQLATGSFGGDEYVIFPGTELLVEGMLDVPWNGETEHVYDDILEHHMEVRCVRDSRTYRILQSHPTPQDAVPLARLFANVDLRTQRWRFSGRPIYSWISPTQFRADAECNVAMELARDQDGALDAFEAQLFFDRDDVDCEVTRARLLGPGTELANVTWEKPSATYYRHASTLISRYSGAYRPGRGDPIWPRRVPNWSRHVAILAEASRVDVTRPQVRCLIPLSQDPATSSIKASSLVVVEPQFPKLAPLAPSPPLTCVLEERPFEMGGLAERIVSELVTGVGYGFEPPTVEVQPIDAGKEAGRDGRLETRSWMYDRIHGSLNPSHLFVVEPEGPIGLHFDEPTVPAPAWSNCQFLLKPRTIDGNYLPDELFVGVRLRRILDPDWVVNTRDRATLALDPQSLPLEQSYQVTIKDWDATAIAGEVELVTLTVAGGTPIRVLWCAVEDQFIVFYFNRQLIGPNYTQKPLILCALPLVDALPELRLLHTPYADGRYTLSVLAELRAASIEKCILEGRSNFPRLLASMDWRCNEATELTGHSVHLTLPTDPICKISTLTASSSTFREWGRTAKNSDWVHCLEDSQCQRISVAEVKGAKRTAGSDAFLRFSTSEIDRLWLVSSLADSRQPLYVQRHLVAVFTKLSGGSGKQFDLFCGASMLNGTKLPISPELFEQVAKVELHELEIPAAIVAAGVSLPEFQQAYLDLIATGGRSDMASGRNYRMHLRFANSAAFMEALHDVKVVVWIPDNSDPSGKRRLFDFDCDAGVRAVDVFVDSAQARYRFHTLAGDLDGPHSNAVIHNPLANINGAEALILTLQAPPALGELWADVSLVHSAAPRPFDGNDFDFDWLFSADKSESSAATRTSAAVLSELTEAQARFVSSSPPIDLVR